MKMRNILLTLLLASVAAHAGASTQKGSKYGHDEVAFDPAVFEQQRKELVTEVKHGDRYSELDRKDRETVLGALDTIGSLLSKVDTIDALSRDEKNKVFNLQEQVNNLLTDAAADSRMICTRETAIGSHRPINICKTAGERRRTSELSRDGFRDATKVRSGRGPGE